MISWLRRIEAWIAEPEEAPDGNERARPVLDFARQASRVAVVLTVFVVVNRAITHLVFLPEDAYRQGWILGESLRVHAVLALAMFVSVVGAVVCLPRLRRGWNDLEGGRSLRWLVCVVAAALMWTASAYSYNAYFDQLHWVDRVTVVVLGLLIFWRPIMALPFVISVWVVMSQFYHPGLGYQSLVGEFKPLANVIALFASALLVRAVVRGRTMPVFLFLTICLVAGNFWYPAFLKLKLNWLIQDQPHYLVVAAYTHGWLAFLTPSAIARAGRFLAHFDGLMRLVPFLIEFGAILLLLNRQVTKWYLIVSTVLLGVFFSAIGYLFWMWMVLQLSLLLLLIRGLDTGRLLWIRSIYSRGYFVLSLIVIAGSAFWFSPARLAWLDTPLATTVLCQARGVSGQTYELPPGFFAPYQSQVAMGVFVQRLAEPPVLTGPYGVTHDRHLAEELSKATDVAQLERIEEVERTRISRKPETYPMFARFVRQTVAVSNRRLNGEPSCCWPGVLRPPTFIWTFSHGRPYRREEPIQSVRVFQVASFFDGSSYRMIRKRLVGIIEMDTEGESVSARLD